MRKDVATLHLTSIMLENLSLKEGLIDLIVGAYFYTQQPYFAWKCMHMRFVNQFCDMSLHSIGYILLAYYYYFTIIPCLSGKLGFNHLLEHLKNQCKFITICHQINPCASCTIINEWHKTTISKYGPYSCTPVWSKAKGVRLLSFKC